MPRTLRPVGLLAAGLLLALTACGDSDDPSGQTGSADASDSSGGSGAADSDLEELRSGDVPEDCVEPFPMAIQAADLFDVTLRPTDFPDPPVDSTLCQTSSTLDDSITTADYATPVAPTEVLDAYEAVLSQTYDDVVREDQGMGEVLTADLGEGRYLQLTPGEGRYSLAFGTG